jgi:hypothetical protein
VNDITETCVQDDGPTAVSLIALGWKNGGLRAPTPASSQLPKCCMPDCAAMSYVQLKTPEGYRSLCFQHFTSVKQDVELSSHLNWGR